MAYGLIKNITLFFSIRRPDKLLLITKIKMDATTHLAQTSPEIALLKTNVETSKKAFEAANAALVEALAQKATSGHENWNETLMFYKVWLLFWAFENCMWRNEAELLSLKKKRADLVSIL